MEKRQLTGFPSIDRPWLKYYSEEAINAPPPECTMYEYMARDNRDEPDRVALNYMGRRITYGTLLREIDKAATAFYAAGLRQGDIVSGIVPSFPETIYSIYGLNKIGVITNWFDLRMDKPTIVQEIKSTKSKMLLVFDEYLPGFESYLPETGVKTVISISKRDSLPAHLRLLLKLKKRPESKAAVPYWDFIDQAKGEVPKTVENAANLPAVMEHTGGTTGVPKAVVLTNQNASANIHQYRHMTGEFSRDEKYLTCAFPFTAYTLICTMHDPLVLGLECYLCYSLDVKNVEKFIFKHRINQMSNTPMMWEQIIHSAVAKNKDLSFLVMPTVGADALAPEKELEINRFLEMHNCRYKIVKGYGMTEVGAGVAITPNNEVNKIGSVGIPFSNTTIAIFDPETGKELGYNEEGEICISGPSVMRGYYNAPEATAEVLKRHDDGLIWMHSGDIGVMDTDGFLFVKGRIKRMFMDHMGFKIFAPQVEAVLSKSPHVDKCCVVGIPDKAHGIGKLPVAYIIAKDSADTCETELRVLCEKELPTFQNPYQYIFVETLPYTSASKVDYRALEKAAEEM